MREASEENAEDGIIELLEVARPIVAFELLEEEARLTLVGPESGSEVERLEARV